MAPKREQVAAVGGSVPALDPAKRPRPDDSDASYVNVSWHCQVAEWVDVICANRWFTDIKQAKPLTLDSGHEDLCGKAGYTTSLRERSGLLS